jgi:hypothetical protein
MSPYLAAGILAAAYKLGLLPESLENLAPAAASGIIGYGVGHEGHDELIEQLRRSEAMRAHAEEVRRHEAHEAFMRELVLRQALEQKERDARIHAALEAALQAHGAPAGHR